MSDSDPETEAVPFVSGDGDEGPSNRGETRRPRSLVPERIPQPHGGVLQRGSALPSPGALPGRIRASLRDDYEQRLAFLRTVVDGGLVQRIAFHVNDLRQWVMCGACGSNDIRPVTLTRNRDAGRVEVEIEASASPKDRIAAMDQMARYGLGTLKEVSTESVRAKVGETLAAIRRECDPATVERLYVVLRDVWK